MKANEIIKIYGTDYKENTKRLLEEANLSREIEEVRKALPLRIQENPCKAEKLRDQEKSAKENFLIGIKPNLVSPSTADYGATTHPEIVAGIIEYLLEHGFKSENMEILEGSWVGDRTTEALEVCGYNDLSEKYNISFKDMQKDKFSKHDCAGVDLNVCKEVDKLDFLINVPVLKGHCQTKITCALKNMKGLIPNTEKRQFHRMGLHKPIAHLNTYIKQNFIVIDHICGDLDFEDGGNPVVRNCIMAAKDPVLVDAYVCEMLHYETKEVPYVTMAASLGVGSMDLKNAEIYKLGFCDEAYGSKKNLGKLQTGGEKKNLGKLQTGGEKKNLGKLQTDGAKKNSGELQIIREKENYQDIANILPLSRKIVEVQDFVEEVESCSACYGYLVPALDRLRQEGLLKEIDEKISIGQGYRGKSGKLGVGNCTAKFDFCVKGCPPTDVEIYQGLKNYISEHKK